MKVLYEKESLRLLGAQIVGGEGVDKRIDVLATAIRSKMKALELTELDLSYAPPYSSAKLLSKWTLSGSHTGSGCRKRTGLP